MKNRQNPQGFAIVEAILVLIIVALIATVGLLVWHNTKSANKALSTDAGQTSTTQQASNTAAADSNKGSLKYLTIESGVKIPYTANYDFSAIASYTAVADDAFSIYASTVSNIQLGRVMKFADGSTVPTTSSDEDDGNTGGATPIEEFVKNVSHAHINGYYYYPVHLQSGDVTSDTMQTEADSAWQTFITALPKAVAD